MEHKYLQELEYGFLEMATQTKVKNQQMEPGYLSMNFFRYAIIWFSRQDRLFFIVLYKIRNIEFFDLIFGK